MGDGHSRPFPLFPWDPEACLSVSFGGTHNLGRDVNIRTGAFITLCLAPLI